MNVRNTIVAHEYLGDSVEGKTVFIADDIIASGESMLEVAGNLKKRGAGRIIANATFPLVTSGLALKGVKYREVSAGKLLSRNLLVYGLGGLAAPFIFVKLIDVLLVFTCLV